MQVRHHSFKEDSTHLIYHEEEAKRGAQEVNSQLIASYVEQIEEVVTEVEEEALNDQRVVVGSLGAVVLDAGRPLGDIFEVDVHDDGYDDLDERGDCHTNCGL